MATLGGNPNPWVTWSYTLDGGVEMLTDHTEVAGVYTVTVPENDGSYTTLDLTVHAYNSVGNATDTISVTVGT